MQIRELILEMVIRVDEEIVALDELKSDGQYAKILSKKINLLSVVEAKDVIDKLINYCKENDLQQAYPWFLIEKGKVYYKNMDFENAIIYHIKAFKLFKIQEDKDGILNSIVSLIADYGRDGKYDLAMEWALKGINLAEEYNNQESLAAIKVNMSGLYMELEEFDKAKEVLDELIKAAYFEYREHEVITYINKAECERNLKNLDEAVKSIKKAYKISKDYAPKILFNVLVVKANIYVEKQWYSEADDIYKEALLIAKNIDCFIWVVEILFNWIALDLKMKNFDIAISKLQEIESIRENNGASIDEALFCKFSSEAYKGLGMYKKAYFYLERYVEFKKEAEKNKNIKLDILNDKKQQLIEKTYKVLYKQAEALYKVGQSIISNLEKEDILNVIISEVKSLIEFDLLQIVIYDESICKYKYELILKEKERISVDNRYVNENTFTSYCINNKKEILIGDIIKEYKKYISGDIEALENNKIDQNLESGRIAQSLMFVPIIIGENIIGVISTQHCEKSKYGIKELTTLKILSTYIGIALENSRLYKEVKYSATHDVLTNIYNRREVLKRYYKLYNKGKHEGFNLSVMMIDIDNFKNINDVYGHQCGDEAIKNVAEAINYSIRKCDIVGRYGGEEFLVVVVDTDDTNTEIIAERIRQNIENLNFVFEDKGQVDLTISMGVKLIDNYEIQANKIIGIADEALYKAKNSGKNKVIISEK